MKLLLIYILGSLLSYGIATWLEYVYQYESNSKYPIKPRYKKTWQCKTTIILSLLSWLGVILCSYISLIFHKRIRLRYSYKSLWNNWKSNIQS